MARTIKFNDQGPYLELVWAALLFLVLFVAFLVSLPPGILMDDSGEMIAAAYNLGLPHPPGYPFFDLVGHIFSWLPVGSVAFRFNLLSTIVALLGVLFLLKSFEALAVEGHRTFVERSLFISLAFFMVSSPAFMAMALSAKGFVYVGSFLIVSILIWLRLQAAKKEPRLLYGAWFAWGLGMACHWQTFVLLLAFMLVWSIRDGHWKEGKTAVFSILSVFWGLSLYLYLPLRASLKASPSWGDPSTWKGFQWVVLRKLVADEEGATHGFGYYWDAVRALVHWDEAIIPILFLLAGLWALFKKDKRFCFDLLLVLIPIPVGIVLVHESRNLHLIPFYSISVGGLFLMLIFYAFWDQFLSKGTYGWVTKISWCLLMVLSFGFFFLRLQIIQKANYRMADDFGRHVLMGLPRNAVLLADGDIYVMPLWYEQYVEGKRPDVIVQPSVFLYHEWGWDQLKAKDAVFGAPDFSSPSPAIRFKALAEKTGRPLYYSLGRQFWPKPLDGLEGKWVPMGLADRWMKQPPGSNELFHADLLQFNEWRTDDLDEMLVWTFLDPSTRDIKAAYFEGCMKSADWLVDSGSLNNALCLLYKAQSLDWANGETYSKMAVILGRQGYLRLARYICHEGLKSSPETVSLYVNWAKLETALGQYQEAREAYQKAIDHGVDPTWAHQQMMLLGHQARVKERSASDYAVLGHDLVRKGCQLVGWQALSISRGGTLKEN